MNKVLLIVMAAALLVAFLAYNHHQHAQAEIARREAESLRQQAEELRQRAQQQADEAQQRLEQQSRALAQQASDLSAQASALHAEATALKEQVSAEHEAAEAAQRHGQVRLSRMEGLSAANAVRTAVAERYMSTGKLPESNREAGVAQAEQFKGRSLQRLDVGRNGSITLTFDEKAGGDGGGVIRLVPEITNTPQALKWRCVSPSYEDIAIDAPQCEYRAGQ